MEEPEAEMIVTNQGPPFPKESVETLTITNENDTKSLECKVSKNEAGEIAPENVPDLSDPQPVHSIKQIEADPDRHDAMNEGSVLEGVNEAVISPPTAEDSGCHMRSSTPPSPVIVSGNDSNSSGERSPGSSHGQDSGVSPDDILQTPSSEIIPVLQPQAEDKDQPLKDKEIEKVQNITSICEQASPEGSGGVSETHMTVSDLDSPVSPEINDKAKGAQVSSSAAEEDSSSCAGATSSQKAESEVQTVYYIKWIMFDSSNVPIITQNDNGPCPLLALLNVLLLKGKVKLAPMLEMITAEQLMTCLGECILENAPKNLPEQTQANYEQNMQDAMGVMHKLQTGLDVNVKFTGVREFEYTPELIVFDLLGISLFHGWLVDPQDTATVTAVNQCSYNQLVERIIALKHSDQPDKVTQALTAEQFLERSASQLTYHGLAELCSVVKEKELCVFFRNNHFNTLYRRNNELFLLVTDQGFLTESNVVWETLGNVEGDCHFTDAEFRTYTRPAPSTQPILPDPCVEVGSPEQIDHDYQVALFLQGEIPPVAAADAWPADYSAQNSHSMQSDHDLAVRLQEEENRRQALQAQQAAVAAPGQYPHQQQQQWARNPQQHALAARAEGGGANSRRRPPERREKEEKNCVIL